MYDRISVRLDSKTISIVKKICEDRGEQLSDFVHRSIKFELGKLGYLNEEEKKALGVE